jgi:hypothetical protein
MHTSCSLNGAAGMAVAMMVIGIGLGVHFASARPSLERSGVERSFNPTPIDRTLKGDRLPGASSARPAQQLRLPDGCEARFSRTIKGSFNELARQCMT